MNTAVIITAIICVTLIIICALPRRSGKEQEYEYNVIHVTLPREKQHTGIMEGIRAGQSIFGGEVVAIINEPLYQDMGCSPVKNGKKRPVNPNPNYRPPMKDGSDGH